MTSSPANDPRLAELVRLRRVRDRIDRDYSQPLNVEARVGQHDRSRPSTDPRADDH